MTVRLYDTMTRHLQPIEPLQDDEIHLYTCGPTVWQRAHVGNFRTYIFEDVLRRWLERRFSHVVHVMNLTDVDDRIINNARAHGRSLEAETAPWIEAFFQDIDVLGIRRAHHYPRATDYIDEMVALIERLEKAGAAYRSDGSYYFRIAAFPRYGRLSGFRPSDLITGASGRIDADDYQKDDARDFALWKAVAPDDPYGWDTRIGRGRPGWHVECSAMSMALLGESFELHCGGIDNIFPHHENEIAQSEAATHTTFVHLWCHGGWLLMEGEKMAKRVGNVLTVPDVLDEGVQPASLRYMLAASTHYRKPLSYADEPVAASREAVERLVAFRDRVAELPVVEEAEDNRTALKSVREARTSFGDAMDDDLNLPEAMGAVFTAIREFNRIIDATRVNEATRSAMIALLDEVDDVLGLFPLIDRARAGSRELDEVERGLLKARDEARAAHNWSESDRIREQLGERGIAVEDTPAGQRWKRVP